MSQAGLWSVELRPETRETMIEAKRRLAVRGVSTRALERAVYFFFHEKKRLRKEASSIKQRGAARRQFARALLQLIDRGAPHFRGRKRLDIFLAKKLASIQRAARAFSGYCAADYRSAEGRLIDRFGFYDQGSLLNFLAEECQMTSLEIACLLVCGTNLKKPNAWLPAYRHKPEEESAEDAIVRADAMIRKTMSRADSPGRTRVSGKSRKPAH